LLDALSHYTLGTLLRDLTAGVTVGVVALPLAMAFGIASGVTPEAGIYTAIVGGALVSLLGGSRVQIAGPTGAFVVVVAAIVREHGIPGLWMVTLLAGLLLVGLALTGLGRAVRFIPRPVVIGFTNGIAVLIASTQIKDLLGLAVPVVPADFVARLAVFGEALPTVNGAAVGLAGVALAVTLLVSRWLPRVPGSIVALVLTTAAVALFHLPVETIGSAFGGIPTGLPAMQVPTLRIDLIRPLLPAAVTVALLAAVESLLSAVVADGMTGGRHNADAELLAQGVANIAAPLVGGMPVTGAIARTATNVRSGGETPVAGIVHALTLLVIILVAAPLARHIPLATLAAVLLVVAYNMGEWREVPAIWRLDWAERTVWLLTFALTVVVDLTVAVEVGMGLAALLYIFRVSDTSSVALVTPEYLELGRLHSLQGRTLPPYVSVVRIHGPFLFGLGDTLHDGTLDFAELAPIVILRLRNMTALDASGLHALERFASRVRASGRDVIVCGARDQPARFFAQADFAGHLGANNLVPHIDAALARAAELHAATVHGAPRTDRPH
jgi:sulfate permease, SulP family